MSNASEPAPPSDRIRGSRNNSEGSARTTRGGIDVSPETERALRTKVINHNKTARLHVTIGMLKAVYRRGAGAFSVSHRPGKTRNQWAMARVNAFLDLVANGKPNRAAYVSDNDLLPKGHRLAPQTPAKAFASQRQWRWAFATEQPFARRWADESTWSKLPRRIRKRATKAEGGPSPVGTYVQDREGQGQRTTPMDQSAGAGERIGGQLCRDADGQYVNCNDPSATADSKMALYRRETQRIRSMNAAQYREYKEQQRAQRGGRGGGGKPKLTPEQEAAQKEQERLKQEEEQRKEIAQNIEKTSETSPLGKDDAKAFAAFGDPDDPKGLTDAQTEKLEKLGLVKRDKENNFASMTREGRAYLQSLRSGDKAEARDAFADVQEAIAERRAREAERAQIKEEREKAKQEREKAKQERASRSRGGKGNKREQEQALQQEIMRQAQMIAYQMVDDYMARQRTDGGIIAAPPEREPERNPEKEQEKDRPNRSPERDSGQNPVRPRRQRGETKSRDDIMHQAFAIAQASFRPPRGVQRAARRALMVRRNSPPSQRGMTAVGLARARDLASGRPVSMNTIIRMNAYFARHEIDKTGSTWDDRGKGWQAWHGWGGDAGRRWAAHILRTAAKALQYPELTFRV